MKFNVLPFSFYPHPLPSYKAVSGLTDNQMRLLAYAAATGVDITAKNIGGLLGLTPDMAAAIHAYTQESKFYKKLNVLLRSRARAELKPFFPYLKLFMSAMHRLPPEKCTLYVMPWHARSCARFCNTCA